MAQTEFKVDHSVASQQLHDTCILISCIFVRFVFTLCSSLHRLCLFPAETKESEYQRRPIVHLTSFTNKRMETWKTSNVAHDANERRRHAHNGCRPVRCIFFSVAATTAVCMVQYAECSSNMQKTLKTNNCLRWDTCAVSVCHRFRSNTIRHSDSENIKGHPSFRSARRWDLVRECTCFTVFWVCLPNGNREATAIYVPHQSNYISSEKRWGVNFVPHSLVRRHSAPPPPSSSHSLNCRLWLVFYIFSLSIGSRFILGHRKKKLS